MAAFLIGGVRCVRPSR